MNVLFLFFKYTDYPARKRANKKIIEQEYDIYAITGAFISKSDINYSVGEKTHVG